MNYEWMYVGYSWESFAISVDNTSHWSTIYLSQLNLFNDTEHQIIPIGLKRLVDQLNQLIQMKINEMAEMNGRPL